MPYFVFKITRGSTGQLKALELLDRFDVYKAARDHARGLRARETEARTTIKLIFAENEAQAEEQLTQAREQPILREWEK